MTEHDIVKSPAHYPKRAGHECMDVAMPFGFHLGNAIKYIWRAGLKGGPEDAVRDLEKAKEYIQEAMKYSSNDMEAVINFGFDRSLHDLQYEKIREDFDLTSMSPYLGPAFSNLVDAVVSYNTYFRAYDGCYYNEMLSDAKECLEAAIIDFKRRAKANDK